MALYAAMAIEGVLAKQNAKRFGEALPIPIGVQLFNALRSVYKIVLLTHHEGREEEVEYWLKIQGITTHTSIARGGARAAQLNELRVAGYPIELYVDADPSAVAEGIRLGVTSLLFSSPVYSRPEFRPDSRTGVRPWAQIAAEVEEQNTLKKAEPIRTADMVE